MNTIPVKVLYTSLVAGAFAFVLALVLTGADSSGAGADIISLRYVDDDVNAGDKYVMVCDQNYIITHTNIVPDGTLTDETVNVSIAEYPLMDDKAVGIPFLAVDLMQGTFAATQVAYDELQMDAGEGFNITVNMPTDDGDERISIFVSGLKPVGAICTLGE